MTDKNIADVADKAVDKLAGGIEAVARAVEKVAPHVWEVTLRQVRTEGAVSLLLGLALIVFAWRGAKWSWPGTEKRDYDSAPRDVVIVAIVIVAMIIGGIGVAHAREGALLLANPHYYAAMRIVEAAK